MANDHTHASPAVRDLTQAFKWAATLNVGHVLIEVGAGFVIGSLALLVDAAHNLKDVAVLLIAWGAVIVARRPPSDRFSYCFGRTKILAALPGPPDDAEQPRSRGRRRYFSFKLKMYATTFSPSAPER